MVKTESRKLMWFGHKIAGPDSGRFSKPSKRNFHNFVVSGRSSARARGWARLAVANSSPLFGDCESERDAMLGTYY